MFFILHPIFLIFKQLTRNPASLAASINFPERRPLYLRKILLLFKLIKSLVLLKEQTTRTVDEHDYLQENTLLALESVITFSRDPDMD